MKECNTLLEKFSLLPMKVYFSSNRDFFLDAFVYYSLFASSKPYRLSNHCFEKVTFVKEEIDNYKIQCNIYERSSGRS